ncbi:Uncharacterised protein [Bordetella pertussis]|nr:Uncharacterised protein [Bordetella pertussis]
MDWTRRACIARPDSNAPIALPFRQGCLRAALVAQYPIEVAAYANRSR